MFGDNISAEGQIGPSLRENVDTRKYFFSLEFLIIPCLPEYGWRFAHPEGPGFFSPVCSWHVLWSTTGGMQQRIYHDSTST